MSTISNSTAHTVTVSGWPPKQTQSNLVTERRDVIVNQELTREANSIIKADVVAKKAMILTFVNIENSDTAVINSLLDQASLYVGYTGVRYVVGPYGSIKLDLIIERLKVISGHLQDPIGSDNRKNGTECVEKIRKLYRDSDKYLCAKVRNVFETVIDFFSSSYRVVALLTGCCSVKYSPRASIDVGQQDFYSIGPQNIEQNFRWLLPRQHSVTT